MPSAYLLDTSILILLARGKEIAKRVDAKFGLRVATSRPLICSVTLGEVWALAETWGYGEPKRRVIRELLENLVVVDIHDEQVVKAYVEVYLHLHRLPGGSRANIGENDLWIAAATRAAGATLLTADKDFDPLHPSVITREWIDQRSPPKLGS